jgi:hypothetical protein
MRRWTAQEADLVVKPYNSEGADILTDILRGPTQSFQATAIRLRPLPSKPAPIYNSPNEPIIRRCTALILTAS